MLTAPALLERLSLEYGPQAWWPAETTFEVMVGALLVQRTTWTNAARAIQALRKANLLEDRVIAAMMPRLLAPMIRVAGFYNTKAERLVAMARFVAKAGGTKALARLDTQELRKRLLGITGVGAETADAILLYGYERPVFVDDAYARRLIDRINAGLPRLRPLSLYAAEILERRDVPALNEIHALIVEHGKQQCRVNPICESCPLRLDCDFYSLRSAADRPHRERRPRARRRTRQ